MSKPLTIPQIVFVFISSFLVHELGHIIAAILQSNTITAVGIGLSALYVVTQRTPTVLTLLAGGFLQSAYLSLFVKRCPEILIAVASFLVYALWEADLL